MTNRYQNRATLQNEVAQSIVETLNPNISSSEIKPDTPLFSKEGLGLDSIDALELELLISKKYGVEIKSEDAKKQDVFANLSTLVTYIERNQQPK